MPGTPLPPGPPPSPSGLRSRGHGRGRLARPLLLVLVLALSACGSVLQGQPRPEGDQQVVTAPSGLPVPVASAARVGASAKTNWLTGEDVPDGPVLAVKVDNTSSARPQAGLSQADVVYVEEVEGGVTRLLTVFQTELPAEVGPVRSARTSDILILGGYDAPGFAFSGANSGVIQQLEGTDLRLASMDASGTGFVRAPGRTAPYDVIGDGAQLLARLPDAGVAVDVGLRFGAAPDGGRPAAGASYTWDRARIDFAWSEEEQRWRQSMDGTPSQAAEGGQLAADTVVFQEVPVVPSPYVDVNGARSPEVRPVGGGAVTVLRDGQVFDGRWSRPGPGDITTFTTTDGAPLRLHPGQTWVVFVAQGTTPTLR